MPPALPRPPISTCALITHGIAERLGGGDRLLDGLRGPALGHGNAVLGEELLALVFEEVHGGGAAAYRTPPA